MSLDAGERQVVIDLIGAVRTLATQVLRLHLQLGAVRALLARKGIVTEAELNAAVAELGAITTFDELTNPEAPGVDEVFDDMMRRLERGQ
jgi:hypothetical protein